MHFLKNCANVIEAALGPPLQHGALQHAVSCSPAASDTQTIVRRIMIELAMRSLDRVFVSCNIPTCFAILAMDGPHSLCALHLQCPNCTWVSCCSWAASSTASSYASVSSALGLAAGCSAEADTWYEGLLSPTLASGLPELGSATCSRPASRTTASFIGLCDQ